MPNNNGEDVVPPLVANPPQVIQPVGQPRLMDLSVANLVEVFRGDGTGPSVKEFFRIFENAAAAGRWAKDDMLRLIQLKLKGPAATFVATYFELSGNQVDYDELKKVVTERFLGKQTQQYHYSNLQNAVQLKNESVEAYADRIRRLGALTISHRATPAEQKVVNEEAEKRMLNAFLHGLLGVPGQVTRHKFPETWDEALQYAVMVAADERSHPSTSGVLNKAVFATLVTCYNCGRPGHVSRECRAVKPNQGSSRQSYGQGRGRGEWRGGYDRGGYTGRGGFNSNNNQRGGFNNQRGGFNNMRGGFSGNNWDNRRGGRNTQSANSYGQSNMMECFTCHERGHGSRNCPKNQGGSSGSENRGGPMAC